MGRNKGREEMSERQYYCIDCNCFVDQNHRCQQWSTVFTIPVEAILAIEEVQQKKIDTLKALNPDVPCPPCHADKNTTTPKCLYCTNGKVSTVKALQYENEHIKTKLSMLNKRLKDEIKKPNPLPGEWIKEDEDPQ